MAMFYVSIKSQDAKRRTLKRACTAVETANQADDRRRRGRDCAARKKLLTRLMNEKASQTLCYQKKSCRNCWPLCIDYCYTWDLC